MITFKFDYEKSKKCEKKWTPEFRVGQLSTSFWHGVGRGCQKEVDKRTYVTVFPVGLWVLHSNQRGCRQSPVIEKSRIGPTMKPQLTANVFTRTKDKRGTEIWKRMKMRNHDANMRKSR